jgi:hypothetical protein
MKTNEVTSKLSFIVIMMILVTLYSCQKIEFPDPSTLPQGLQGTWIEASKGVDTIIFNSDKDTGGFYLARGRDYYNGYLLPKIGSAPYAYIIKTDSIYVVDGLSSTFLGRNYYFNFNEPSLTINIGKFCKYIEVNKSILTFRKIK